MFRKIGLPLFSLLGVFLALYMVYLGLKKPPIPVIEFPPPVPPFTHYVAGSGIIEASSLNITIGTPLHGLVEKLYVEAGALVKKEDPLFRVDTRQLAAQAKEFEASKAVAAAQFNRLVHQPRPEEVPPLIARVKQAEVRMMDESTQFGLFENVNDKRAISFNDYSQHRYAANYAESLLEEAKANLVLLKAGAWIEDLKIAASQVEQEDARLHAVETDIERSTIRAPCDGQVLRVNIREGEFVSGSAEDTLFRDPLILFGQIDPLHIRIDVDEADAWRVFHGASAVAYVRGNSAISIPLEFVRIEPYVVPKRSLTGEDLERVDTRVLQVIYKFSRKDLPIYVGQLMDAYIEAKPSRGL